MTAPTSVPTTVPRPVVPELPRPRGPVSAAVTAALRGEPLRLPDELAADPYGEDAQLALYCLYELHYRGFVGVDPDHEWSPVLLELRRELERAFLGALSDHVPGGEDVDAEVAGLGREPPDADGNGLSHHLLRDGELWQLREYIAIRSLYHLKEADPQAWAIPRLPAPAKAGFVAVEYDEYGSGDPARVHAELFARMMRALGLDDRYGAHLDTAPAEAMAEVNFMSLCGLRRSLRGALVGQFVTVEVTSSPGSDRLVRAMRRLDCPPEATEFYAEHVEADAVHEQVVRRGVLTPLLAGEPELAGDVVFGIRAAGFLAQRLERHVLGRWAGGSSALTQR